METYEQREYSVGEHVHSTIKNQMSAVGQLAALILARKVRISLPDQSNLVLQSFGQLNEKPNPSQLPPIRNNDFRRHSTTVGPVSESLNKSDVFPKFNIKLANRSLMLTKPGDTTTDNNTSDTIPDTTTSKKIITRKYSAPHFSVLPNLPERQQRDSDEGTNIISQYIRRQSHNDILALAEYKGQSSDLLTVVEHKAESSDNTPNKPIMPSSSLQTDAQKPIESNTNIFGFSILSRTRQFGAWLTKATEGDKVEVTKKDLNALAPNSF